MNAKEIHSDIAIALTFVGSYLHISAILKGTTKPHVFSWTTLFFPVVTGVGCLPLIVMIRRRRKAGT